MGKVFFFLFVGKPEVAAVFGQQDQSRAPLSQPKYELVPLWVALVWPLAPLQFAKILVGSNIVP